MNDRVAASLRSGAAQLEFYGTGLEAYFAERIGQRCAGADRYAATETANALRSAKEPSSETT